MKTTYNRINYLILISSLFLATLFSSLFLHNQSYTEYLLVLDSWRFLDKLFSNSALIEYCFHNVHIFALPSFILYLDILISNGNLQFLHHIVLVSILTVFLSIIYLSLKHKYLFNGSWFAAISLALFILSMWLSPSNARAFTYPLLDVISSVSLLSIFLIALVYVRIIENQTPPIKKFTLYLLLILISCVGLFTLEIFISLVIVLACDSLIRKKYHVSSLLWLIFVVGAAFYLLSQKYLEPGSAISHDFNFQVSLHNFLVFLSSHIYFLISGLGWGKQAAIIISILFSISGIAYLIGVSGYVVLRFRRLEPWLLLPLLLVVFSLASLSSATWLRFSDVAVDSAIGRYTTYSMTYAIGIVLVSVWLLAQTDSRLVRAASLGVLILYFFATSLDAWAMCSKSHNMGYIFIELRKEMPVYAQRPGQEIRLGPVEPDGGEQYRGRLHSFLENNNISVFSSMPYLGLNTQIKDSQKLKKTGCLLVDHEVIQRKKSQYISAQFELSEPHKEGIFVVLNGENIITDFSFASIPTPFSKHASGMFRLGDNKLGSIFYLPNPNGSAVNREYIKCDVF